LYRVPRGALAALRRVYRFSGCRTEKGPTDRVGSDGPLDVAVSARSAVGGDQLLGHDVVV
jgi:hypothetical protein